MVDPAEFRAPSPPPSLSEVIVDFARPALAAAPPGASMTARRLLLTLAIRVWNECVGEATGMRTDVWSDIEKDMANVPEEGRAAFTDMARTLYERKRAHFADDRRIVVDWQLTGDDKKFGFRCAGADARPKG